MKSKRLYAIIVLCGLLSQINVYGLYQNSYNTDLSFANNGDLFVQLRRNLTDQQESKYFNQYKADKSYTDSFEQYLFDILINQEQQKYTELRQLNTFDLFVNSKLPSITSTGLTTQQDDDDDMYSQLAEIMA